jgi:hypothetical protein
MTGDAREEPVANHGEAIARGWSGSPRPPQWRLIHTALRAYSSGDAAFHSPSNSRARMSRAVAVRAAACLALTAVVPACAPLQRPPSSVALPTFEAGELGACQSNVDGVTIEQDANGIRVRLPDGELRAAVFPEGSAGRLLEGRLEVLDPASRRFMWEGVTYDNVEICEVGDASDPRAGLLGTPVPRN